MLPAKTPIVPEKARAKTTPSQISLIDDDPAAKPTAASWVLSPISAKKIVKKVDANN